MRNPRLSKKPSRLPSKNTYLLAPGKFLKRDAVEESTFSKLGLRLVVRSLSLFPLLSLTLPLPLYLSFSPHSLLLSLTQGIAGDLSAARGMYRFRRST